MVSYLGAFSSSSSFLPSRTSRGLVAPYKPAFTRRLALNVRAASTSLAQPNSKDSVADVVDNQASNTRRNTLACPVCFEPLVSNGDSGLSLESVAASSLQCGSCMKTYFGNETHLELVAASGAKRYGDPMPASTEIFRTPLVSFLYERGWRQSFSVMGGFPGPEEEFELSKKFFEPVLGGNIVDASCGSGMFSRLFAKSGLFSQVIALDYSENMLRQCYEFIEQENSFPKENINLVRAEISRLPFVSSSIDAVHAGAALHCWPSPLAAVAEISRVLRPGGVFVATTYILDGPFGLIPFLKNVRQNIRQASGSYIFLSARELEDLCKACGLVDFTRIRNRAFIMISASKPA